MADSLASAAGVHLNLVHDNEWLEATQRMASTPLRAAVEAGTPRRTPVTPPSRAQVLGLYEAAKEELTVVYGRGSPKLADINRKIEAVGSAMSMVPG